MTTEHAIAVLHATEQASEARLIGLVLDGVTSTHSRRSYRTGLVAFFAWIRESGSATAFSRALVQGYRAAQIEAGMSASTLNLRLSPIRKLAREMSDNGQGTGCSRIRPTPC